MSDLHEMHKKNLLRKISEKVSQGDNLNDLSKDEIEFILSIIGENAKTDDDLNIIKGGRQWKK